MSDDPTPPYSGNSKETSGYPFARDRIFLTCGLASALLIWAAFDDDHSAGFYTFLRIYIGGLSLIWAVLFRSLQRPAWALAALCSAILFNPIFPIEFAETDWQLIDAVAGAIFGWLALQPYSLVASRPWAPYLPGLAMASIAFSSSVELPSRTVSTMNVDETLTTESVVVGDPFADIPMRDNLPVTADSNMVSSADPTDSVNEEKDVSRSPRIDYSGDWLNLRPNGSTASRPEADQQWLDEVLNRKKSTLTDPPAVPDRAESESQFPPDTPVKNDVNVAGGNIVVSD
jgi:hypothetical protein